MPKLLTQTFPDNATIMSDFDLSRVKIQLIKVANMPTNLIYLT